MVDFSNVAQQVFSILQSYDYTVMLYDDDGNRVIEPEDARRLFARPENMLISLIDNEDNSAIKLFIGENTNINSILNFINALRTTATSFNILFNIKKYGKEIKPSDFSSNHAISENKKSISEKIISSTMAKLKLS